MKAYRVNYDRADVGHVYRRSRNEAHRIAKLPAVTMREALRIELVEVRTDKDAVTNYLNDNADHYDFPVLKTWRLNERGALREVPNGE